MWKSLKLTSANSSTHGQRAHPHGDRFGSVAQPLVPKNSVDMSANRRIGYPDLSSNLLVGETCGHQGENLRLARREMLAPHWHQLLHLPRHHNSSIGVQAAGVKEERTFTPCEVRMQRRAIAFVGLSRRSPTERGERNDDATRATQKKRREPIARAALVLTSGRRLADRHDRSHGVDHGRHQGDSRRHCRRLHAAGRRDPARSRSNRHW